jgi:hypothetical protein
MDSYDREIQREIKRLYSENKWRIWLGRVGRFIWDRWFLILLVVFFIIFIINIVRFYLNEFS